MSGRSPGTPDPSRGLTAEAPQWRESGHRTRKQLSIAVLLPVDVRAMISNLNTPPRAVMLDLPDPGLALVAEHTGGGYTEIRFGQDLGAAFARVADELHSQYLISFAPPKRDAKAHDIDVRVNQRGLRPRARKNYVAPKE
jgi:hypothetical protein